MISNPNDRNSQRRNAVVKGLHLYNQSDTTKLYVEYLHLLLDNRVTLLLTAMGEEAIALRGEMRCIKHLLSVLEQGLNPFTDSITQ